jgi:hypothetical protein
MTARRLFARCPARRRISVNSENRHLHEDGPGRPDLVEDASGYLPEERTEEGA